MGKLNIIEKIKEKGLDLAFNKLVQPKINTLGLEEVRTRLYENINPRSYIEPYKRFKSALNNQMSSFDKTQYRFNSDEENYARDNIFAEYLNIPEDKRHNYKEAIGVSNSEYSPSLSKDTNTVYKKLDLSETEIDNLVSRIVSGGNDLTEYGEEKNKVKYKDRDKAFGYNKPLNIGENRVSNTLKLYLGPHTISRGMDPQKGEYIAYYDKWDISPYKYKGEDQSRGIGTPIEFYDRVYLNDYYKVNPEIPEDSYYGGYIQPAVKIASKKSGGRLKRK